MTVGTGFEYWSAGLVILSWFTFIIVVPCVGVLLIGTKEIDKLGLWPTKSAIMDNATFVKLFILGVISFGQLSLFLHIFQD